jgi:hypothetical protein
MTPTTRIVQLGWLPFTLLVLGAQAADRAAAALSPHAPPEFGAVDVVEAANVRNFGAKGDGKTDDTIAIQTALLSAYRRIYVPSGTYRLTNILWIPSNKQLTLSPSTVMLRTSNASAMLLNDADGRTGGYGANKNIIIEGGTWNGNTAEYPSACTIIAFGHATDIIVRDCSILNTPTWHSIELNGTRRCTIEWVTFDGCTNEAVQLDTMNSGGPEVFPWFGPYDDTLCRDILIQDCIFQNVATAIGSHSAPPVDGLVIRRCLINASSDVAIKPVRYVNLSIEECEFNNCHTVFAGSANNFVLKNNRIFSSRVEDLNLANCTNGSVENNVIINPKLGITNSGTTVALRGNQLGSNLISISPRIVDVQQSDHFIYYPEGQHAASGQNLGQIGVNTIAVGTMTTAVTVAIGDQILFAVTAIGTSRLVYQWYKDGVAVAGATSRTYSITDATPYVAGVYSVSILNSANIASSSPVHLSVSSRTDNGSEETVLSNLSIRTQLTTNEAELTVGLAVRGKTPRNLLVRSIGPSLDLFGVSPTLSDPQLAVYNEAGLRIAENDNWSAGLATWFQTVGAFPLQRESKDAALLMEMPAGLRTIKTRGIGMGAVLVELFDFSSDRSSRIVNLSAKSMVGTGDAALIAGFTLTGKGFKRLLIRGVGARLADFGVAGSVSDPRIELRNAEGTTIATNNDWDISLSTVFADVGAFSLVPGSKDAAFVVTVSGQTSYSVVLRSAESNSGEALLEIYEVEKEGV